jgi:hypothetical protein
MTRYIYGHWQDAYTAQCCVQTAHAACNPRCTGSSWVCCHAMLHHGAPCVPACTVPHVPYMYHRLVGVVGCTTCTIHVPKCSGRWPSTMSA